MYAGIGNIEHSSMPTVLAQAVLFPAAVFVVGRGSGALAERNRQFAELTDRLRRQQEEKALQALTEERVRIARELHDVVAHHMSVISLQAGMASYVFPTDPEASRLALDTIADTSREALEEMRRMLVLLRVGEEEPRYGQPPGSGTEDPPRTVRTRWRTAPATRPPPGSTFWSHCWSACAARASRSPWMSRAPRPGYRKAWPCVSTAWSRRR